MSAQSTPDDRTHAELLNNLRFGSPDEQEEALVKLTEVGEAEALDAVVEYLLEQPAVFNTEALDALRVLAYKFMPFDRYSLAEVLIPFLSSSNWQERLIAIRLFTTYPNELSIEPLRDLIYQAREKLYLTHGQRPTQERIMTERALNEAVLALSSGGRLMVLPDVLEMLEDHSLRIVATRALGLIGSDTERPRLEDLIEDRDPRVRDAAQWALGLMDERAEQFMNPPMDPPPPPPDRLNPLYWIHRQLRASSDELLQFLIVRVAIEHLLLDQFISDGQVPEVCTIIVRHYVGDNPPCHKDNQAEITGIWEYHWHGPRLRRRITPESKQQPQKPVSHTKGAILNISYPESLPEERTGLVCFDCQYQPFQGQGQVYQITNRDGEWFFNKQYTTWET